MNRIDEVVVFDALSREDIIKIVAIQLRGLQRRLEDRKLTLELTEKATTYLANAGYDPNFGARPLKRPIQREIQDPLALLLLSGDIRDGDTVVLDAGPDGLTPRVEPRGAGGDRRRLGRRDLWRADTRIPPVPRP